MDRFFALGSFPAGYREDFSRRIRICGPKCSFWAARPWNVRKFNLRKIQNSIYFGGFLVIARNPSGGFGRKWVEMVPTGLPELSKPFRDLLNLRKTQFLTVKFSNISETNPEKSNQDSFSLFSWFFLSVHRVNFDLDSRCYAFGAGPRYETSCSIRLWGQKNIRHPEAWS